MNLSQGLFWDADTSTLDPERHARDIINRVLLSGTEQDWAEIKRHYGLERIREEALQMRYLSDTALSFCSTIFDIPRERFRCYTLKQSLPEPWNY